MGEDVHKPLLAVSSIVRQGHKVVFAEEDAHIALKGGGTIPMGHVNGTYEVDTWIKKPVFHRTDRAIEPFIRPLYHFGLSGLEGAGEEGAPVEQAGEVGDTSIE